MVKQLALVAMATTAANGAANLLTSVILASHLGEDEFITYAVYLAVLSSITLAMSGYFLLIAEENTSVRPKARQGTLVGSLFKTATMLSAVWLLISLLWASRGGLSFEPILLCGLGIWIALFVGLVDGRLVAVGALMRLQVSTSIGAILKLALTAIVVVLGIAPQYMAVTLGLSAVIAAVAIGLPKVWRGIHRLTGPTAGQWGTIVTAAVFWATLQLPTLAADRNLNDVSASNFALAQTLVLAVVSVATVLGLTRIGARNRLTYSTGSVMKLVIGIGGSGTLVLLITALLAPALPVISQFQEIRNILLVLCFSVVPWSVFAALGQQLVVRGSAGSSAVLAGILVVSGLVYGNLTSNPISLAFAVVVLSILSSLISALVYAKQIHFKKDGPHLSQFPPFDT